MSDELLGIIRQEFQKLKELEKEKFNVPWNTELYTMNFYLLYHIVGKLEHFRGELLNSSAFKRFSVLIRRALPFNVAAAGKALERLLKAGSYQQSWAFSGMSRPVDNAGGQEKSCWKAGSGEK